MFKEEYCTVDLSVSTSTDNGDTIISIVDSLVSYDNLTIASIKSNDGLLISDFENGFNPNWDYFYRLAYCHQFASHCNNHCSTCVAQDIRAVMI